ncbi:Transcription factor GRAS [Macleaya cordata]|uniref:Transcription factor GRAS n=1 Tax=Macleaya cordata TaxID=56857 RepID=A0A200QIE7_MACCD|nr:Transcription factor GRAS [Macleaya cordata]
MARMVQDEGSSSVTSSPLQFFSLMSLSPSLGSPYPWLRELKSEERGLYLIHLLLSCANHVAAGSLENANIGLEQISHLASPDGDTMQRIASYFSEALADRILKAWPGLHKALNSTRLSSVSEGILVRKLFFELCPFLKLSFVITNQAILEAMEGEKMVHIIDLNAAEPAQWIALLQALSARPEGPPHLRITGIHEQKEVLEQTALRLTEEAEKLDIPFQFNPIVCKLENLDVESLRVKTGEALAISSVLQLHTLLASDDENLRKKSPPVSRSSNSVNLQRALQMNQSTLGELLEKDLINGYSPSPDSASSSPLSLSTSAKMESFLAALWGLSPKIMLVTEQESNHNGPTFMERLLEALYFYASLFDCLESTVSRSSMERMKVEKMLFGEEIKNIIACEGTERKERHEKLEKWIQRLDFAGFGRVPMSYYGLLQARRLLQSYGCDGYKIKEENGCLVICWQDRALFSVSAWRCRRYD